MFLPQTKAATWTPTQTMRTTERHDEAGALPERLDGEDDHGRRGSSRANLMTTSTNTIDTKQKTRTATTATGTTKAMVVAPAVS
jgi:hypothetical protein